MKRIVAIADAPAPTKMSRDDVTDPRVPEREESGNEERDRAGDEHDVLPEDDRRRCRRVRERLADEAVEAPHGRGDADEDDPGNLGETLCHRSKRRRSFTGCRARIRPRLTVRDEDGGRIRDAVVRRRHRQRVCAGRRHREQVAAPRVRKRDRVDEDVAGLAVLPGDAKDAIGQLIRAVGEQRFVARAVQLRPRVVRHAAVDRDVRNAARFLDDTDAIERDPCAADERAARLEHDLDVGQPFDERRNEVRNRGDVLLARVLDAEAAADVEHARTPVELCLRALAEGDEAVDGDKALLDPCELRPDVEVDAGDVHAEIARGCDRRDRCVGSEPELRLVVRGLDRLVGDRFDAWSESHEDALHSGGGCARRLVGRVEDDRRAGLGCGAELLVRLVVPVEEDPAGVHPRLERERELAQGRDVGADALFGEQPEERDVRERLRAVDDLRAGRGSRVRAGLGADGLLAVDDERRAVLVREVGGGDAADR